MKRPYPPLEILAVEFPQFEPALELTLWVKENFLSPRAKLYNPDHAHLADAHLAFLWANLPYQKQGRRVLGLAELGKAMGSNAWKKALIEQQRRSWFMDIPDFLITLDAAYCTQAPGPEFCALLEHELYHCAQAVDAFGAPRFNEETGRPMWTMRGHDVEEFVGVVKRYGAKATRVTELVEAAERGPTVAAADVSGACGTCLRLVA